LLLFSSVFFCCLFFSFLFVSSHASHFSICIFPYLQICIFSKFIAPL
jgi:hypothetical protein